MMNFFGCSGIIVKGNIKFLEGIFYHRVIFVNYLFRSFVFFFSLGFGARLLRPLFRNEKSWRVLDVFIALVMWSIALSLILGNY